MDIILTKGDDRCGTTMDLLNKTYEKVKYGEVKTKGGVRGEKNDDDTLREASTLRSGSQRSGSRPGTTDSGF